jgi:pre-mRNA-splicing helicase BRR2
MFVVALTREGGAAGLAEGAGVGAVAALRFPAPRSEGWWLVLAQPGVGEGGGTVLAVKRLALGAGGATARLDFAAPAGAPPGAPLCLKLFLMSDSYVGCDQELDVSVDVGAGAGPGAGPGGEDGAEGGDGDAAMA